MKDQIQHWMAKLFLTSVLYGLCFLALADMYVDKSIIVFPVDSATRQDVKVTNSDDETMYIEVEVFKVLEPGTGQEERIKDNPRVLGLLATPNKLVIPPKSQKLVRLVNLEPQSKEERIYRINITPIVPPLEENVSQLRIVVAYQILAIVQPPNPESKLIAHRSGKKIIFTNEGNTNVLLSEGKQCDISSADLCESLESHRLYAGNTWELKLPYDAPVSFAVRSFDGIKQQIFP
ncbi:MAG: fimbria/pilus periplasmic chaperone [Gammaproteobacteria bacterium]|nr:fimbria/pilus periplasmic chaperone [Gammaproteobacteria bacterium]